MERNARRFRKAQFGVLAAGSLFDFCGQVEVMVVKARYSKTSQKHVWVRVQSLENCLTVGNTTFCEKRKGICAFIYPLSNYFPFVGLQSVFALYQKAQGTRQRKYWFLRHCLYFNSSEWQKLFFAAFAQQPARTCNHCWTFPFKISRCAVQIRLA